MQVFLCVSMCMCIYIYIFYIHMCERERERRRESPAPAAMRFETTHEMAATLRKARYSNTTLPPDAVSTLGSDDVFLVVGSGEEVCFHAKPEAMPPPFAQALDP